MAQITELEEGMEVTSTEVRMRLLRILREAVFVERLAEDLKEGRANCSELPALLENLSARLAKLARPVIPLWESPKDDLV